jgi:hypothetical protein
MAKAVGIFVDILLETRATLETENLDVVADRSYFDSAEILACEESGITVTLPKPMTSGAKTEGRFGKQDFVYVVADVVYLCPAGRATDLSVSNEEDGTVGRRTAIGHGLSDLCARAPLHD